MDNNIKKRLINFHRQAKKLENRCKKDSFFNNNLKIKYKKEDGVRIKTERINEEDMESILIRFRPFYTTKKDEIRFPDICDLLASKNLGDETEITEYKKAWNLAFESDGFSIKIDNNRKNMKDIFSYWLNEEYFHPENYKPFDNRGLSELVKNPIIKQISLMKFVGILQRLCFVVINFNKNIVEEILRDKNNEN